MDIRPLAEDDAQAYWDLRREALETEPFAFGSSLEEHLSVAVDVIAHRFRDASAENFSLGVFDAGRLVASATFAREKASKNGTRVTYTVYM